MRKNLIFMLTIITIVSSFCIPTYAISPSDCCNNPAIVKLIQPLIKAINIDASHPPHPGQCCDNPDIVDYTETTLKEIGTHKYMDTTPKFPDPPPSHPITCHIYQLTFKTTRCCNNCGKQFGKPRETVGPIIHSGCNRSGAIW